MSELAEKAITELIRNYYKKAESLAPDRIEQREFGFGEFSRKIAFRHISFKNEAEFRKYLVEKAPPYADYSAAYYKFPSARPMENKVWLGSELRFDLDASDKKFECKKHEQGWLCEERLDAVKADTIALAQDFLIDSFGFEESDLGINFSGNRGYHVHITKESVMKLSNHEREEIANFIKAIGLKTSEFFPALGKRGESFTGPKPDDYGWGGIMARNTIAALGQGSEAVANMGVEYRTAKKLCREKALIEMGIKNGNWDMVRIDKKAEVWSAIAEHIVKKKSVCIDENVTIEKYHLMRLQNTIHGSSGLLAKKIKSISALDKFAPLTDPIVFREGEMKIKATTPYALEMNGQSYGPFSNNEVILPTYVAVYLYLKGYADIISVQS